MHLSSLESKAENRHLMQSMSRHPGTFTSPADGSLHRGHWQIRITHVVCRCFLWGLRLFMLCIDTVTRVLYCEKPLTDVCIYTPHNPYNTMGIDGRWWVPTSSKDCTIECLFIYGRYMKPGNANR